MLATIIKNLDCQEITIRFLISAMAISKVPTYYIDLIDFYRRTAHY